VDGRPSCVLTYRQLIGAHVQSLPPIQSILYLVIFFEPLIYNCRSRHTDHIDDIYCIALDNPATESPSDPERDGTEPLTMVRGDQLVDTVVRLTTTHYFLAIVSALGQLVRPVHPVDPSIDVMFIARSDLEDASYPVVV